MVLPDEAVLASISSRANLKNKLYELRGRLGLLGAPEALVDDDEDDETEEEGEEDIDRGGDQGGDLGLDLELDLLTGVGGECLLAMLLGLALVALFLYVLL